MQECRSILECAPRKCLKRACRTTLGWTMFEAHVSSPGANWRLRGSPEEHGAGGTAGINMKRDVVRCRIWWVEMGFSNLSGFSQKHWKWICMEPTKKHIIQCYSSTPWTPIFLETSGVDYKTFHKTFWPRFGSPTPSNKSIERSEAMGMEAQKIAWVAWRIIPNAHFMAYKRGGLLTTKWDDLPSRKRFDFCVDSPSRFLEPNCQRGYLFRWVWVGELGFAKQLEIFW